ncbi:unnamed protein product [Somion occarium]|uniref:Uncharacterized protein n=1 Tax=Somion occarium TaxID=3059160 RepID=A0ABP1DI14_9APHY
MSKPTLKLHPVARNMLSFDNVQSHLSATSSQPRLRNPAGHSPFLEKTTSVLYDDLENNNGLPCESSARPLDHCFTSEISVLSYRFSKHPCLVLCLIMYCSLSLVIFTASLLRLPSSSYAKPSSASHALHPYTLRSAHGKNDSITACLWTNDSSLDLLPAWVAKWTGMVSILVTTTSAPSSVQRKALLRQLKKFQDNPTLNRSLNVHLMQVDGHTLDNPNAYLNFARLFSPTPQVVLVPGNLSVLPPKAFYRSFFSNSSASARNVSSKPILFTSRGQPSFPYSSLSPVVMSRDDPLWCTERFFLSVSRQADWSECLWQVWLEHFGDLDVKQTTDWVHSFEPGPALASLSAKLRRRLGGKFRSETCMLATRQLAALRTPERGGKDAKKARWLKRQCREWMTLA